MVNLLYTELLKLKRSNMFLISIIGAGVAPFLVVVASYIHIKTKQPTPTIWFHQLFTDVNLYTTLVIGFPLYGVVVAYLLTREYAEDTLKNLLTIPVSRISFIISKFIILFLWIMMLTLVAWALTLILGLLGNFPGFSRAGSTISGGLLAKVNYKTASEFSFLIALPVMIGATGLDLLKSWKYLSVDDIPMFAVGFITSFIVAMLAVVTFLKLLEKIGLKPFAYYRILLAILFTLFVLL
ncbi:ABC transporter permease [Bacillus thuringiensis]|uniref:ABC transporter permease n=1 Tax=Bacillus thuringiensis TaxID=1428 RepID=UPI0011225AED|nr:ABC transporter permease [Bacillus thuringiensis]